MFGKTNLSKETIFFLSLSFDTVRLPFLRARRLKGNQV